jgi:hypothetical protein
MSQGVDSCRFGVHATRRWVHGRDGSAPRTDRQALQQGRSGANGEAARGGRGFKAPRCACGLGARGLGKARYLGKTRARTPRAGQPKRGPAHRRVRASRRDTRSRARAGSTVSVNARLTALNSKNLNWMKFSPKTKVVVWSALYNFYKGRPMFFSLVWAGTPSKVMVLQSADE